MNGFAALDTAFGICCIKIYFLFSDKWNLILSRRMKLIAHEVLPVAFPTIFKSLLPNGNYKFWMCRSKNTFFGIGEKEPDLFGSVVRLFKFGTVSLCKKFAVAIEHQAGDGGLHGAVKFFVKLHDRTCRNLRVGGVDIINRMQNF